MNNVNKNLRILIVDDNRAIHADFRKILCQQGETPDASWEAAGRELFGEEVRGKKTAVFELDSAYQGKEALEMVRLAVRQGRPYAMAFVDVRMPPGWDGMETTEKLWEVCPDMQIVICTAYSDYSWEEMATKLVCADRLLLLKKPFDTVEVLQLASALTEKWRLQQQARIKVDELESLVQERTRVLLETNQSLHEEVVKRQRAAEALRESEERYQLLFSKNPLPMWVYDVQTLKFLAANETAVREYGYTVKEFLAMSVKDIRAREETSASSQNTDTTIETAVSSYITRHRKKDGSCIDAELISRRIFFAGRCANLVLASDITERKAAEDRIHEQATLLDLAHDAIYARDLSGRIQFWNKGAERLYGWTSDEVIGRTLQQIFPLDFTGTMHAAEKILLEKGEWSGELQKHNRQKQELIVNSRWTLLRDDNGQPRSVLTISADVTEKKKLESQFLRAQRMEGIGTLATGMAHDLNNILAPILMSAGSLRWELNGEERELAISGIEASVKRGAEIIQQVLTFGRGVTGDRAAVNPRDSIGEVASIISQTFPKDIAIRQQLSAELWPILGDRTQIHQTLLNLSINARDAMPKGGQLTFRAENCMIDKEFASLHEPLRPGPYVRLEVSDTGEGIAEANLEKIFDPFFTTKEFGKGTGLGLSTVLGIVKSHHGLVRVESTVNKGATFKVWLPALPEAAKRPAPAKVDNLPRGDSEIILVVDDETNILTATRNLLEQYGYRVVTANSGKDALAIFTQSEQGIAAVVTDIMMPGINGVELTRSLRRIDPNVRVIASSGVAGDFAKRAGAAELKTLQVTSFLAKPYSAENLLEALRKALGDQPPRPEANQTRADKTTTSVL